MQQNIHKRLLRKLFWGWLILSLLIGSLAAYREFEHIDQYVVGLAQNDSTVLIAAYRDYHNESSEENARLLEESAQAIARQNRFVMVEFYSAAKERIAEFIQPHSETIMRDLELRRHHFLMGKQIEYAKLFHGKRIYLKLVIPITSSDKQDQVIGYFEGVYQVAEREMAAIIRQVLWAIIQVVLTVLITTVILYPVIISLNRDLIKLSENLADANLGMLKVLGGAIAKRDSDTNAHNYRVTIYAIRLAEKTGTTANEIQALIKGAFLHDVGKIAISDNILLKPGKLTDEEFTIMKTHVSHGVDIIRHYKWLHDAVDVVRYHHEKHNGKGYLKGLSGEEIPRNAAIFAIADVFDALTSHRPYKEAFSYEKSAEILLQSAGTHFNPELLDAFLEIARSLHEQLQGNEDEDALDAQLGQLLKKYFPTSSATC